MKHIFTLGIVTLICSLMGANVTAQVYNNGPINISGNVYVASSFTNSASATYLNNGSIYLTGDFTNNQAAMAAGTGTISFVGSSLENINGGQSSNFYNATTNNAGNVKMGDNVTVNNVFYPQAGSLQINGNTLNIAGTINNAGTGTISGDATNSGTSNLNITGTGALGTMNFAASNYYLNNLSLNRTSTGTATMGTQLYVYGTAAMTNGALVLNTNTLSLSGAVTGTGTGTFTGDNSATMNVLGSSNASLGILYFTSGGTGQNLGTFNINRWNGTTVANAATLGTNLTANNLGLTYGVLSTGYNLLTTYSGAITAPNIPWTSGSATFGNSYVATCDATGTPLSQANNTTPLANTLGFQINNVGPASGEVYFPVGASFLPAGTGITAPTPDRMSLKMKAGSVATNFNVVVNYGDIDNTPNARVSRVWYVNAADTTATDRKVNMKLFFVERNTANWPAIENEVENTPNPFDYTNIALIERDYSATDPNFIAVSSGTDITNFPNGTYNNQEVYGQYTVGVSPDVAGNKNGIYQFNRFSLFNPGGIILPVKVINFKAYQQGSGVQTSWTSLNEVNMEGYEIERSADAENFVAIGSVSALNNGQPSINYSFFDVHPSQGNNYYRIKILGKDGSISYTNIEVVAIGGGTSSINIYPNPVTNHMFVLQMNNLSTGNYTLLIYNTIGQLILNQVINHTGGSSSQTIQLPGGTARGEYALKLLGTDTQMNKMITVE
jgi:hypothetical protein